MTGFGWVFDIEEMDEDPWVMAKSEGIYISSNMEFSAALVHEESGRLAGCVFVGLSGDEFSFDVAVSSEFRRQGLGKELIDHAFDTYAEFSDMGDDLLMRVHVVNPVLIPYLEKKGMTVVDKVPGGDVVMGL